jgi:hypothetical protein
MAIFDDERRARADGGAGFRDVLDDLEIGARASRRQLAADIAALAVVEADERILGEDRLDVVGQVGAVAAGADRRADELGRPSGRWRCATAAPQTPRAAAGVTRRSHSSDP